jgi:hypothetical protein
MPDGRISQVRFEALARAPPQSRVHRGDPGLGHSFMRALSEISEHLRPRPSARTAGPLLRHLRSRRPPSPHARRPGILALSRDTDRSVNRLGAVSGASA